MAENKSSRFNKGLVALVALLLVVAAVQGYYLYRVWHGSDSNIAYAKDDKNAIKDWKVAPDASDPLSIPLTKPIDPNSYNPFKEMVEIQKQMDAMFGQAFGHFGASPQFKGLFDGFSFNPNSDLEENDKEYIVRVDVPGADASKIKATLEGQTLTISGITEAQASKDPKKQLQQERRTGKFERVIALPSPVKQEGMKTDYKDGVMTITIPKDTNVRIQPQPRVQPQTRLQPNAPQPLPAPSGKEYVF
jgi:HSP20 family protein